MNEWPTLRQACLAGGSHPVAFVAGQPRLADDLRRQALALAAHLVEREEQCWALWLASPYEFLVAFLALTLAGKDVILPGNMQPGTARLLAPHFQGLISRQAFDELECVRLEPDLNTSSEPAHLIPSSRDVSVTLFTSGSTGEPKAVAKRISLLEEELKVQQQQWQGQVGRVPVVATVSHQHIYGLLHAVLWPFLRRAPFVNEICQYPEELAEVAECLAPVLLVSSPTHLARLPRNPLFDHKHRWLAATFSSGGLLETDTALALAEQLGRAPFEILGSTETGGVAWRQQGVDCTSQRWRALPGVTVSCDSGTHCLAVSAGHLEQPCLMGDRVVLSDDGSFALDGRADRLVKVEGKRLSITEMERRLQTSALVETARIAVLEGKRQEVGAVVVLSGDGRQLLACAGKLALNQQLRDELLAWFERPLLPRRWRYRLELPQDAQGKTTARALEAVFLEDASAEDKVQRET